MTKEYRERLLKHYETIGNKKDYEELKLIMNISNIKEKDVKKHAKKST